MCCSLINQHIHFQGENVKCIGSINKDEKKNKIHKNKKKLIQIKTISTCNCHDNYRFPSLDEPVRPNAVPDPFWPLVSFSRFILSFIRFGSRISAKIDCKSSVCAINQIHLGSIAEHNVSTFAFTAGFWADSGAETGKREVKMGENVTIPGPKTGGNHYKNISW